MDISTNSEGVIWTDYTLSHGPGAIDWELYGEVLKQRAMEIPYPEFRDDFLTSIATERRVRKSLYDDVRQMDF